MPESEKRAETPTSQEAPVQEEKKPRKNTMEATVQDPQLQTILAAITAGRTESSRRFDAIDGKIGQLCIRQDKQEKDIEFLKNEVAMIKADRGSGISAASSPFTSRGPSSTMRHNLFEQSRAVRADEKTDIDEQYSLPMAKLRVLAVGGFPEEMDKDQLEETFKVMYQAQMGADSLALVEEFKAPYKLGNLLTLILQISKAVWKVLTSMTGKKFVMQRNGQEVRLWHGIDRSPEERAFGRRISRAATLIKEHLTSSLTEATDVDGAGGFREGGSLDKDPRQESPASLYPRFKFRAASS